MKKMFKAAASLAVGCALLSTSAFAALTSSDIPATVETNTFKVTVDGGLAAGESTILGLKGNLSEMPASILDADILYINQATVTETTVDGEKKYYAEYNVGIDEAKLQEAGAVSFFAGGSAENSASWLGTVLYSTGSNLPEGAKIELRNANPYGLDGYAVVKITGITSGSVKVKDADGTEVDAYLADYTAEGGICQYVALVKGSSFDLDDIVYDSTAAAKIMTFGDINADGKPLAQDAALIVRFAGGVSVPAFNNTFEYARLAADINADGKAIAQDAALIVRKAGGLSVTFSAIK